MNITAENIEELKGQEGQCLCTLEELKDIYTYLERPRAKAVKVQDDFFVTFEPARNIQFKIIDNIDVAKLAFIIPLDFVDATKNEMGFAKFMFHEFYQGETGGRRLLRIIETSFPLGILNVFTLLYASEKAVASVFAGVLTAVSIFIAIFSLFTVGQEHLERKKLTLFKNGKLAYLFSVDKNITALGITIIMISLFATLVAKDGSGVFWNSWYSKRNWLVLVLLNISFFGTWLILRSLVEFYIHRPAKFILGDIKKEFLESF